MEEICLAKGALWRRRMTARDEPADGLLLGKDFAPAGARYFCPWWQKYPKAPFKGKGISYFPFPLKIPIP